ncbi:chromosome segregation in meiosis protein 3-like [Zingiber officinale]|uniref:CCHC-type domain-containing protein n=1 Tax=Zingiber officinale TaxID=94328 RepID=A0A8J5EQJ5_ZINOF|nr:chromosome segregation in meiosis protein 3-like [Zingiber officinale]KAG6472805.1 hypothetical protein ZIOFF_070283 [Zingiber officinale]
MEKKSSGGGAKAAPTGCFKCGGTGHWSRDCPSSSSNHDGPSPNLVATQPLSKASAVTKSSMKKAPRTRPKLTPQILLSEDGLGYVLRHFPRAFKYRGRGHEAADLGNLIGLYSQWHSQLIPYYSFDQFVRKVEQVGATKRVTKCISELKDRVANGGDPSKLHESPIEEVAPEIEQDDPTAEEPVADAVDPPFDSNEADHMQEDEIFNEIYHKATEEAHHPSAILVATRTHESTPEEHVSGIGAAVPSKVQISEEQRARMEANRLKALERAAARARSESQIDASHGEQ